MRRASAILFRPHLPRIAFGMALVLAFAPSALTAGGKRSATESQPADLPPPLPKFEEVEKLVRKEFAERTGYRRGDLIARAEVSSLFPEFEKLGWKVSDRPAVEGMLLTETDVLVRELRAPKARDFMRHVSAIPGGFDRVDRLRRMPYGQQRLGELIRGPDGHLLIQYLATTPNGRQTGTSIANGANGRNFNDRTGRLYTEQQLLEHLRTLHARDAEARARQGSRATP